MAEMDVEMALVIWSVRGMMQIMALKEEEEK